MSRPRRACLVLTPMTTPRVPSTVPFHQYRDTAGNRFAHAARRRPRIRAARVPAVRRSGAVTYAIANRVRRAFGMVSFPPENYQLPEWQPCCLKSWSGSQTSFPMPVVTMSEAVAALRATVGRAGMPEDELRALADYLMSFFGFEQEAIDNNLDVADRDAFYMLEEEGLLTTRQGEVHIKKGKLWRIHYWILRVDRIKNFAKNGGSRRGGAARAI